MNSLRQYIAVLLLLVFSLGVFPKETLHLLSGHEDTLCMRTDKSALETTHHHCEILSMALPVFTGGIASSFTHFTSHTSFCYAKEQIQAVIATRLISLSLRGPPQA